MIHVGCQKPGNNLLSKEIASFDEPKTYCHTLILFNGDIVCEAHAKFGVRFNRYVPDPLKTDLWRIDANEDQERAMREFCEIEAGCGYDYGGVMRFKCGILFHADPTLWFCSELAAAMLQAGEKMARDLAAWTITPNAMSLILDKEPWATRDWLEVSPPQSVGVTDGT